MPLLTVFFLLALASVIVTLWHAATGRCPLWIGVLLLGLIELLRCIPMGK